MYERLRIVILAYAALCVAIAFVNGPLAVFLLLLLLVSVALGAIARWVLAGRGE